MTVLGSITQPFRVGAHQLDSFVTAVDNGATEFNNTFVNVTGPLSLQNGTLHLGELPLQFPSREPLRDALIGALRSDADTSAVTLNGQSRVAQYNVRDRGHLDVYGVKSRIDSPEFAYKNDLSDILSGR